MTTDYRLTRSDLEREGLPLELEAYPYYPEGIHIPVSEVGTIIVTDPWCAPPEHSDPTVWCTLGVYDYEMAGDAAMIDLERADLASAVIHLMCELRHDAEWPARAIAQVSQWFAEGKG